jgi:two-component system, sensor histidine kinase and response regulator
LEILTLGEEMLSFIFAKQQPEDMINRPKVLVVDDEELSQDFLRFFLSKKFDVYTCGKVTDFYNLVSKIDFDLVLMDVFLRDSKDGIQLTRELKQNEKYRDVPIFVITAHNTTKDRSEAITAGAVKFLTKPVDGKYLLLCIEEVLAKQPHL